VFDVRAMGTVDGGPEVPAWLTAFWLVGPYSFATMLTVLHMSAAESAAGGGHDGEGNGGRRLWLELAVLGGMCCFQCGMALWAPALRSTAGRLWALGALLAAAVPALALSAPGVRVMMTLEALMNGLCRGVALLGSDALRGRSFAQRLGYMVIFHDVTTAQPCAGAAERRAHAQRIAASLSVWVPTAAVALAALLTVLPPPAAAVAAALPPATNPIVGVTVVSSVLRSALGIVFFYSFLVVIDGAYGGTLLLAGIGAEPAMDAPYRSRSFGEFWGRRWDRAMQSILFVAAYRPARALGAGRGGAALATFVLSAAVHTCGVAVGGASTAECGSMFAFFLVQAGFVLIEAAVESPAGWLVTMGCISLSAPLFALPLLAVCGL